MRKNFRFPVLVLDLGGMGGPALPLVSGLRRDYPALRLIVFSSSLDLAPELFQQGVHGYVVNDQGRLVWSRIAPRHFRSTTFLQYKSVLKHAGFLTPTRLGGASAHSYDPDQDQWQWAL